MLERVGGKENERYIVIRQRWRGKTFVEGVLLAEEQPTGEVHMRKTPKPEVNAPGEAIRVPT